jgi:1-phosphatidylinositol-4-phosphate 5-kinase
MAIQTKHQEYNVKKRAEHTFKSFTADSTKISAVDPDFYAERFLNWMESHVA